MKLIRTASGKTLKIGKKEWETIGKTAGWMKTASLEDIWKYQSRWIGYSPEAETSLEDFVIKAINAGYQREDIVAGLGKYYRQSEEVCNNIYDRVVNRLDVDSPLNGKSKQSARNYIYKLVGDMTKGIFSDDAWQGVNAIFGKMDQNNIENNVIRTEYFKNEHGEPSGKMWAFEVPFTNNKGKGNVLNGTLTAHFAGSVNDPSDKYDISFVI